MMNSEVSFIEERTKYISNDKEKSHSVYPLANDVFLPTLSLSYTAL